MQVAPILAKHCVTCHNASDPKSGLNLSTSDAAIKGGDGGEVIVPGNPAESRLVERVTDGSMPPENDGRRLTPEEVKALADWIKEGARWPKDRAISQFEFTTERRAGYDWWSLQPVKQPPLPAIGDGNEARSPVDAFIAAALAENQLGPAPPDDPGTLIRRATFDLLGLPPSPQEVEDFLADAAPDAYERLIDRLLASPRYGERWGRHWLDVVRYGESDGFEHDKYRDHAWPYRDYVIAALNQDKPYDRFVSEQLAGDVLEPLTREGLAATGFLVAGPWDEIQNVAKSESEKQRAHEEQLDELLAAVSQSFLGLTANCARCHDHKFDPVPQADYYRLKAVFDGIDHHAGEARGRPWLTPAEQAEHEQSLQPLKEQIARTKESLAKLAALFPSDATIAKGADVPLVEGRSGKTFDPKQVQVSAQHKPAWQTPPLTVECFAKVHSKSGFNILAACNPKASAEHWEIYTYAGSGEFSAYFPGFEPAEIKSGVDITDSQWHHVVMTFDGSRIQLFVDGKLVKSAEVKRVRSGGASGPLTIGAIAEGIGCDGLVDDLRISSTVRDFTGPVAAPLVADERTLGLWHFDEIVGRGFRAEPSASAAAGSPSEADVRKQQDELAAELNSQQAELASRAAPLVYAGTRKQPAEVKVLLRGDITRPGPAVTPGGLSALRSLSPELGLSGESPEGERRLKFAAWVASEQNPLTARVMAGRLWQFHFGRGLMETPSDLGFSGGQPSHRELLDHLAADFGRGGWSIKRMHRRLMGSATYRQSAAFNAAAARVDADNRLLWRFAPRRLEGETVRDAMLAASGEINLQMGGPSYRPFTVTVFNTHFYHLFDSGEPQYNRRTVYRACVTTGKSPFLTALDCPAPSLAAPKRRDTTTPLQALALMNDSFVQRQAEKFAARVQAEAGADVEQQISQAWQIALAREPRAEELSAARGLVQAHSLRDLCWALFNSSEFLYLR